MFLLLLLIVVCVYLFSLHVLAFDEFRYLLKSQLYIKFNKQNFNVLFFSSDESGYFIFERSQYCEVIYITWSIMTPSQIILSKIIAGYVIQKSQQEARIMQIIRMRYYHKYCICTIPYGCFLSRNDMFRCSTVCTLHS